MQVYSEVVRRLCSSRVHWRYISLDICYIGDDCSLSRAGRRYQRTSQVEVVRVRFARRVDKDALIGLDRT